MHMHRHTNARLTPIDSKFNNSCTITKERREANQTTKNIAFSIPDRWVCAESTVRRRNCYSQIDGSKIGIAVWLWICEYKCARTQDHCLFPSAVSFQGLLLRSSAHSTRRQLVFVRPKKPGAQASVLACCIAYFVEHFCFFSSLLCCFHQFCLIWPTMKLRWVGIVYL